MIRCQGGDHAGVDGIPQRLPAFLPLHGRGTDKVSAVRPLVHLTGKLQILRTGFCVDLIALLLCLCHCLHTLLIGKMHNVQRRIQRLCPLNGTHIRFRLYKFRSGQVVIPGIGLALRQEFLCPGGDDITVLRMHLDQRIAAFRLFQHLIEHAVIHAEVIYHEHLEGGYSVCHCLRHSIQQSPGYILHCHMKPVVHCRIRRTHGVPALDSIHHGLTEILHGKVKHSGRTAAGSCPGSGKIIV